MNRIFTRVLLALSLLFALISPAAAATDPVAQLIAASKQSNIQTLSAADPRFGLVVGSGQTTAVRQANRAALQAWFDTICPAHSTAAYVGTLPPGTIEIAGDGGANPGYLNFICDNGVVIRGSGRLTTTIRQFTDNVPIIEIGGHGNDISGFQLYYNTQQATSGAAVTNTGFAGSNGIETWWLVSSSIHDLTVYNATRGMLSPFANPPSYISGNQTQNGYFSVNFWNILFQNNSYRCIDAQSTKNGSLGGAMTGSHYSNIYCKGPGGSSNQNMNMPFVFGVTQQSVFDNINIENINPNAVASTDGLANIANIFCQTCEDVHFNGLHLEAQIPAAANSGILYTGSNSLVTVIGADIYNFTLNNGINYALAMMFGTGSHQVWDNFYDGGVPSGTQLNGSATFCPGRVGSGTLTLSTLELGRFQLKTGSTGSGFSYTCSNLPTNDQPVLRKYTGSAGTITANNCAAFGDTSGQYLVDAGVACGSSSNVQIFTSSGTWTKPAAGTFASVFICGGAGGGGSGTQQTSGSTASGGAGGGGGGCNYWRGAVSSLPATVTVTIAAAASGGAAVSTNGGCNNGAKGGQATFGTIITGYGGGGGACGQLAASSGGGSSGGFSSDGNNGSGSTGGAAVSASIVGGSGAGGGGNYQVVGGGGAGGGGSVAQGFVGGGGAYCAGGASGGALTASAGTVGGIGGAVPGASGGTAGATSGGTGGNGTTSVGYYGGSAGGGGGGNFTGAGGAAGISGLCSGGSGGGSGTGGGGAGAAGGSGFAVVQVW